MRRFRIRACPECGRVQMPPGRDDHPWCDQPPHEHPGGRAPRLAWFDVEEIDCEVNRLNEQARQSAAPGKGYVEYRPPYEGGPIYGRNWATGERLAVSNPEGSE